MLSVERSGDVARHSSRPELQSDGRFYRPELDVVRFIAFLLVFLAHSLPSGLENETINLPPQYAAIVYMVRRTSIYGLTLFFTLSAYLICELLLRERYATGAIHVKSFYTRRILRIWPLYFAGLIIGLLLASFFHNGRNTYLWSAWAAALVGNWFVVFKGNPGNVMIPLWSVSVEEQFYLMAPWAVKLMTRRWLAAFAIALMAFAGLVLYLLGAEQTPAEKVWFNSFVQFGFFAAGTLLCIALGGRTTRLNAAQRALVGGGAFFCLYLTAYTFHCSEGPHAVTGSLNLMGGYGVAALGCCGILLAFLGIDKRFLPRPVVYLGRISYGLYVFHNLAIRAVTRLLPPAPADALSIFRNLLVSLVLTVVLAALSYRFFETPFLKLKRRFEIIQSRPV